MAAAVSAGTPIIPVFIRAPEEDGRWRPGAASNWWLDASLTSLCRELEKRGSRLILRRGPAADALADLTRESKASCVFWNRLYHPPAMQRDQELKSALHRHGMAVQDFNGSLLFEPATMRNSNGKPFRIFSAFWRACLAKSVTAPFHKVPSRLLAPECWPASLTVSDLDLQPTVDWAAGLRDNWRPGAPGARMQMNRFRRTALAAYARRRDQPDAASTSRLSPHLHFGEISPARVWHAVRELMEKGGSEPRASCESFLRQLAWREFSSHLLYSHPDSADQPLRPEFAAFPWGHDRRSFVAWTRGRTGYPFVDAGMRELWTTGWMHNRVRMVAASFLVKHLLISWQEGAAWFWDTLVDADLANNTMGWQWVAGCGADAAPYFRIFNPVLQGEKFDPAGRYVRRWIPELARLPDAWIHKPWLAPRPVLAGAGVELGKTYPHPIVDHDEARRRALAALRKI